MMTEPRQLRSQSVLVDRFQQAGAQLAMNLRCRGEYILDRLFQCHYQSRFLHAAYGSGKTFRPEKNFPTFSWIPRAPVVVCFGKGLQAGVVQNIWTDNVVRWF